jgi:hypothetical protein
MAAAIIIHCFIEASPPAVGRSASEPDHSINRQSEQEPTAFDVPISVGGESFHWNVKCKATLGS